MMAMAWMDYYYSTFGFLFLVVLITAITAAVVSVLFTYFQLRLEDYRWWWRSFNNAGAIAIYVFMWAFVFFMQLQPTSSEAYVLYFGYMSLVCFSLFLMMGFVGVCGSLVFTKLVYATDEEDEADQPLVGDDSSGVELPSIA